MSEVIPFEPSPADPRTLLRKARTFVAPHRASLAAIVAGSVGVAALGAAEPLILKGIFDELGGGRAVRPLVMLGVAFAAGAALRECATARLERSVWRIRIAVHEALTRATVERLHALPVAYHKTESTAGIMTKMDRGINGAVSAFSDVTFQMVPTLAYLALSLVVMMGLDWRVTALVCAFVPVPPLVSALAAGEQAQRERVLTRYWTRLFGRFGEVLSGMVVVKSFAMEEIEKKRFLSGVHEANDIVVRGVGTDAHINAVKNSAVVLARLAAIGVGGACVLRGELSLGTLVAFLGYVGALFGPVQGLAGMVPTVRRGLVGLETIFSILDARDSVTDGEIELREVRGQVDFEDVSFGYRPASMAIRGIDLHVRPGQTVALVGPSGAGKTTVTALLQRLYDPVRGRVCIDGVDLKRVEQRSLRTHIGVVLQDDMLFNDSVRDNIAFGRQGVDMAEIERAARDAHAHDFIMALPEGYDTLVGDRGALLSAGQRQRVAIARAILKNPAILVLDEATSALDAESEACIQEAIARLQRGRTTFIVAHRLATVTSADVILVFRQGQIVDRGTHEELVARSELYASLVRRQTRGLVLVGNARGHRGGWVAPCQD